MRIAKFPVKEREGILRWATLKALTLLRLYRDELDELSYGMQNDESIYNLICNIEKNNVNKQ
jgi:hypothetical protein